MRDPPLNIHSQNWDQFFIAFLAIALFTSRIRERIRKSGLGLGEYLDKLNREYEINDSTTLILIQLGREKKEIHYFSKLTSFIRRWFKDYIERKEDRPSIVTFLDSLTTTSSDSKNKRLVASLREKLVFHLLKYNDINGELLSQLVAIKVEDNLKAERPYGIAYAKQFFAKL
jgi:SNF2 family DNA or RNA helicase